MERTVFLLHINEINRLLDIIYYLLKYSLQMNNFSEQFKCVQAFRKNISFLSYAIQSVCYHE